MSDFTSDFWNWYIIGITVAVDRVLRLAAAGDGEGQGAAGGKVQTAARGGRQGGRDHRPRLGRRPRRVQQPAAAVVDVAVLDHHRLLARLPGALPRARHVPGRARLDVDRRVRQGERRDGRQGQAAVRQVPGDGPQAGRGRPGRRGRWASASSSTTARSATAPTPAAARASPTCATSDWLYGGAPETIGESITNGRMGVMPALGAALGGEDNVKNVVAYVRSLSGLAHDGTKAQLGKRAVRHDLRRLPRRRRQGQSGARRAEPHRQDLAVRQLRGDDRRGHQQGPQRHRDAGVARRCRRSRTSSARPGSSSSRPTSGACPTAPAQPVEVAARRSPAAGASQRPMARVPGAAAPAPVRLRTSKPIVNAPEKPSRSSLRRPGDEKSRCTRSARRSTRAR